VVRRILIASGALVLAVIAAGTWALATAGLPSAHVRVTPAKGSSKTAFVLSFRAPERTGLYGSSQRHDMLTASAPASVGGCIGRLNVRVPDSRAGARVRVTLAPRRFGGGWCTGTYHGRIEEVQSAVCPRGALCPNYVRLRGVVGRFVLKVKDASPAGPPAPSGADTMPPSFTGLQRAFACTPGPQRPGQTTPYTLSWQAATDDLTPSSQIVYDVYLAATSGAEDFSMPTWTTPPGVTTYRTPGLPSHGTQYFIVRARDIAGNRDRNTSEQHGVDPCY
jgi:hypothetical protein